MRILFLTPQLPYPSEQGTSIRNWNIIKRLASRHEIDLLSFGDPGIAVDSPLVAACARIELMPPPGRTTARRVYEAAFSRLPDMASRLYSPDFSGRLASILRANQYDILQVEGVELARYLIELPAGLRPRVTVFDDHNAEYKLQRSAFESDRRIPRRWHAALYSRIQWSKLVDFERSVSLASRHVVAVSEQDARALADLDQRIQATVIPNGVDVDYYTPSTTAIGEPPAEAEIVMTGKMDFRPNVDGARWFVEEVLPRIRQEMPQASVTLVGQKPAPAVQALGTRDGVYVTGWVEDTRPFISRAAVSIVPLRMGGGTRLKVLEAMAMGKPIVSTRLGAEGIDYEPGRDMLVADSPQDFASQVVQLLSDPGRGKELGINARRLALQCYDWNRLVPRFEQLYSAE